MANAEPLQLRIVAFKDGEIWAAQCLEYDIAAQAPDFQTLVRRMNDTIIAEAEYTIEHNGSAFAGLDPAPDYFTAMFESVDARVCQPDEPRLMSQADFRIAA